MIPSRLLWLATIAALPACQTARPATTATAVPSAAPAVSPAVPAPDPATSAAATSSARSAATSAPDSTSDAEVVEEAREIFGDEAAPAEPTWDIDVRSYETHARVEYYLGRFKGPARQRMGEWLSEGTRYEPMIRDKLRAAGLPEDMTYLALIESGYDVHAYSRAAAVGMWQFMATTARGVGLRVDWWVDERRDPVRSTDAAVQFLGWLREQFGSMYLAAAAYNGGPGRVARGLKRHADELEDAEGDDRFFALAGTGDLHLETRDYVPKLIAAALVAKEPARYGITVTPRPPLAFDTVRVGKATPLAAVAAAAGAALDTIRDLNPHLLRGMTPPKDSFTVRVPPGTAAGFGAAYAALPDSVTTAYRRLTTKSGESRAALARRAGLTTTQLAWYNPSLRTRKNGTLAGDQAVLAPTAAVLAAARNVPDPSVERYGTSRTTHVVRSGESLSTIAKKYRTTVGALQRLNGLKKTVIFPGQVIVVRGGSSGGGSRVASASGGATYTVRSGDTLSEIAEKHGTSVAAIKRLNGLRGDRIRAGQKLRVR